MDRYFRKIDYLRVSVTDRCNLRCFYCMPAGGIDHIHRDDILTYDEIIRIIRTSVRVGIRKIRLTGGEPLVRRNIDRLVHRIASISGVEEIGLTTNGVLLNNMCRNLYNAGLCRVNISLDTLIPEKYKKITGMDHFNAVWKSIETAENTGLTPIKINAVVVRGVNDDEIESFARLTFSRAWAVRFIEYMPMGCRTSWNTEKLVPNTEIRNRLQAIAPLTSVKTGQSGGPAEGLRLNGAKGEIGLISPISRHFCSSCNRLRLTARGNLRPCLMSDIETDLKTPLRQGCSDHNLSNMIIKTMWWKPAGHQINENNTRECRYNMAQIGG